jgi:DNA polymerase I-like protein with 3'-5' exonuclease and polymerase domains
MGICQVLGIDSLMDDELMRYEQQKEIARLDFQFLLQVHDSTVWQVRDEHLEAFIPLARTLLEVPLMVNGYNICIAIEGNYGKRWYKKDMQGIAASRKSVEL